MPRQVYQLRTMAVSLQHGCQHYGRSTSEAFFSHCSSAKAGPQQLEDRAHHPFSWIALISASASTPNRREETERMFCTALQNLGRRKTAQKALQRGGLHGLPGVARPLLSSTRNFPWVAGPEALSDKLSALCLGSRPARGIERDRDGHTVLCLDWPPECSKRVLTGLTLKDSRANESFSGTLGNVWGFPHV